jgi:hypothetical protein
LAVSVQKARISAADFSAANDFNRLTIDWRALPGKRRRGG